MVKDATAAYDRTLKVLRKSGNDMPTRGKNYRSRPWTQRVMVLKREQNKARALADSWKALPDDDPLKAEMQPQCYTRPEDGAFG
jgi:hypothetical protein